MNMLLGRTFIKDFICHTTAGQVSDADSLPTAEVFEDESDTSIYTPTVSKRTSKTGDYRVAVPLLLANGFEVGKCYNIIVTATVGGITSKAVIGTFTIENIIYSSGVVSTGSTATAIVTTLAETATDCFKDALLLFTSGNLRNQVKKISAYNGTSKTLTTGAFTEAPAENDRFLILTY